MLSASRDRGSPRGNGLCRGIPTALERRALPSVQRRLEVLRNGEGDLLAPGACHNLHPNGEPLRRGACAHDHARPTRQAEGQSIVEQPSGLLPMAGRGVGVYWAQDDIILGDERQHRTPKAIPIQEELLDRCTG